MTASPDRDALLFDYATGALAEGPALAVATHLALNPQARARYRAIEAAGGALLEGLAPAPVSDRLLEETLRRLDEPAAAPPAVERPPGTLPRPLWRYVPGGLGGLKWTRWGPNIREAVLPLGNRDHRAVLLDIRAGQAAPPHEHGGMEYTVVLRGAFSDEKERYGAGDIQICDGSVHHRPVAETTEDCLCLAVLAAPIRVTSLLGRFVNPFLKF
jgi:putative transcriptional regulator